MKKNFTRFLLATVIFCVGICATHVSWGQTTNTWSGATNSTWLTTTNWSLGAFAGSKTVTTNNDIAYFNNNTQTTVGINMNTQAGNHYLGAINFGTGATTARTINNSSSTVAGVLNLNGATLNSVNNTILWNQSATTHTIAVGTAGFPLGIGLLNTTENIITIDAAGGITINPVISGSSKKLTKSGSGAGVLLLTGANTYTGLTTVSAGTLQLNHTGGTTIPTTNDITVNGGTLQISSNQTINNLIVASGATVIIDASVTLTINGVASITGNVTNGGTLTFAGTSNTNSVSGIISGGGNVTHSNTGTTTFSNNNTYTGGTSISAGTIALTTVNNALATTGTLSVSGTGTLNIGTTNQTLGNVTCSSASTISGSTGILTVNSSNTIALNTGTISAIVAGTGSITKSVGGTSILSGSNTFSGGITISANTLNFAGDNSLGTAPSSPTTNITLTGGAINTTTSSTINSNRLITLTSSTANFIGASSGQTFTYGGTISGSGNLSVGATVALTGNNTFTGTTTIPTGATIKFNPTSTASYASQIILNGGTLSTSGISGSAVLTLSTLNLSANSNFVVGSNAHTINFAASNGVSWTSGKTITITGWQGGYNGTSGTNGQIFVGTNGSGLTSSQLAEIQFNNGSTNFNAVQLSTGEIVPDARPAVTTPTVTSITESSAVLGANMVSNGGLTITAWGTIYKTSSPVAITDNPSNNVGSVSGVFTETRNSLSPQQQYYFAGYASNSSATGLSSEGNFYTLSNPVTTQASSLNAASTVYNQVNLTWSGATFPGSGATSSGYILLRAISPNTPSLGNSNGTAPSAGTNTTIISSTISNAATSASDNTTSATTTYNYVLVPYTWDGTNTATYNYLTASAPTASVTTPSVPAPVFTGFSPSHQYVGGVISITGSNLASATAVTIGGAAASFVVNGSNLDVTIGTQIGQIVVTNAGGSDNSGATNFSNDGYISVANGNYNSNATWQGNTAPATTLPITIANNVTLSANVSSNPSSININSGATFDLANYTLTSSGAVSNNGTLQFSGRGILTLGSGSNLANTNTFTAGNGKIVFSGSNTVIGTFAFNNVNVNGASVDFGSASSISDSLMMNTSASLSNNSPTYTSTSTLVYANPMTAGLEWASGATSGIGVPYKVSIASGNTLTLGASTYRQAQSNLTNSGTLILLSSSSNDLKVAGNWSGAGGFTHGSRKVYFNGITQSVSSAITFYDIDISSTSSVTTSAAIIVNNKLTVNTNGTITIGTTGITIGTTGTADIYGSFINLSSSGNFTISNGSTAPKAVQIYSGGTYVHQGSAGASTPLGSMNFNTGSTMIYRGVSGTTAPSISTGSKTFYNLRFEKGNATSYSTSALSGVCTVNGDFYIGNSVTVSAGTSTFSIAGNYTVDGTYSIGTGIINLTGTSSIGGATTPSTFYKLFVTGNATLSNNVNTSALDSITGTLTMGTKVMSGNAAFKLNSGATLGIGSASGLDGNVTVTGAKTFDPNATYIYNGVAAQTTGTSLPTSISTLTINNSNGVTLSQGTAVTSNLNLTSGIFSSGTNTLTLQNSTAISGASSSNYFAISTSGGAMKITTLNSSSKTFPIGTSTNYYPLTFNTSSSADFTVSVKTPITNAVYDATKAVNAEWNISTTTAATADITFQWNAADEGNSFNSSNTCELGRWTGAAPYVLDATGLNVSSHSITSTGLTYFSSGANTYVVGNSGGIDQPTVAPHITSFTPTSGFGGTPITISGTHFYQTYQVKIGGYAVSYVYVDDSTIIATAGGVSGKIIVSNSAGSDTSVSNFTSNGYVTAQNGDWNTGSTWQGGSIPQSGSNVIINHAVTINSSVANAMSDVTINNAASITTGGSSVILNCSNFTNNGTLDMTSGGNINLANSYTFSNNNAFTAGTGTIKFLGAGTISGSSIFNNLECDGAVDPGAQSTVNGILYLNVSGTMNTHSPSYGAASTLEYEQGGTVAPATEWNAGAASGSGIPNNVIVTNNTTFNFGSSSNYYQINGSLNVNTGSTFSLSTQSGGDIKIVGDWTCSGTFNHNNRIVYFVGTNQNINSGNAFGAIDVSNSNTVNIAATGVSVNNTIGNALNVGAGSTFNINSAKSFNIASGATATINGTVANTGTFSNSNASLGNLIFNSGALFQNLNSLSSAAIPANATWNTGSTCEIKACNTSAPNNFNQNYYNLIWNCASQSSACNLVGALTTVSNDFTINTTNGQELRMTSSNGSTPLTLNIAGNLLMNAGKFVVIGSSTAGTNSSLINVSGNITLNNSALIDMNGGTNAGAATINLYGDLTMSSSAKIQRSFTANSTFNFIKSSGTQNLTCANALGFVSGVITWNIGNGTSTNQLILNNNFAMGPTASTFNVLSGAKLTCGTNVITGNAIGAAFNLNAGATLEIGSASGITSSGSNNGNIQTTTRNFSIGANYTYNGTTSPQATGNALPSSVNNLIINNSTSNGIVNLTTSTTPTNLFLNGGYFKIPSSINLNIPVSSVITANGGDFESSSTGNVNFAGSNSVSGSLSFYPTVNVNGSVDFSSASIIENNMNINSGGSVINNAPFYNSTSTLIYNTSSNTNRGLEWSANLNQGYPYNVQISNNTTFNVSGGAASTARQCGGNITIDNGSTFTMNTTADQMTVPITVKGNLNINGTLELSGVSGGGLILNGNWNRANGATFTEHQRLVSMQGTTPQTITASGITAETFDSIEIKNSSTGLNSGVLMSASNNLIVNKNITLTQGKLNVGNNELQVMDSSATAISGHAAISGNPSSSPSFVVGIIRRKIAHTFAAAYDFPLGTDVDKYEVAQINVNSNSDVDNLKATFNAFGGSCTYAANIPNFPIQPPSNAGNHQSPLTDMLNYGYYQVEPYDATNAILTAGNYTINYDAQMSFNGHTNGVVGSTAVNAGCYSLIKEPSCGAGTWSLGGGTYNTTQQMAASTPTTITPVTLKLFGLAGFSIFGGGFSPDEVLPIELVSFTAQQVSNNAQLNWSTATEKNCDKFEIERSIDGIAFEKIGEIKSKGEHANDYQFTDLNISNLNSNVLYYRLKQVDFAGDFTYSPIRALILNNDGKDFVINSLYPNPFSSNINIQISATTNTDAIYQLFDTKGTMVLQSNAHINKGENVLNIDGLNNLPSGIYLLKINSNNHTFNTTLQKQ